MGKKKSRTSQKSQGIHGHPQRCKTSRGMKKCLNQLAAWEKGKRVMLVVDSAGNKVEARKEWGLPPAERKKAANN